MTNVLSFRKPGR